MVYLDTLRLTDFRSYASLDMEFQPGPVILYGANGSGKTNLLEAISFLSPGRGLRRAPLGNIARRAGGVNTPAWGVNAGLCHIADDPERISVGQVPENPRRRLIKIDGKPASGTALAMRLTVMWLTPAQDRLFTGPASERRKFIDRFTLSHTPDHGSCIARYERARSERNRLLSDGVDEPTWFDALENDMATYGAHLTEARLTTIDALREHIKKRPDTAFPKAALSVEGQAADLAATGLSGERLTHALRDSLRRNRAHDQRAGRTTRGPHSFDFQTHHQGKDMPAASCSTGEQKALLIGLVLAHAHAQKSRTPILLLDEVAAHLDRERRTALAEELRALGTQTFLTGTDRSLFEPFDEDGQFFKISDGRAEMASKTKT